MTKNLLSFLFLTFIAHFLSANEQPGSIQAKVWVDAYEIAQNRAVKYFVEVSWSGSEQRYEIVNLSAPAFTNLKMMSSASSNSVEIEDGQRSNRKIFEFELQPIEIGMAYIDKITIVYIDKDLNETSQLLVNRVEIKILDPIVEQDFPGSLGIALLILILLAGVSIAFIVIRKKKNVRSSIHEGQEEDNLEEKCLNSLKDGVDLNAGQTDIAFANLSSVLRKYLSEKFNFEAHGLTTAEIGEKIEEYTGDSELNIKVAKILQTSDVAKFSGGATPHSTLAQAYTTVEEILQKAQSTNR